MAGPGRSGVEAVGAVVLRRLAVAGRRDRARGDGEERGGTTGPGAVLLVEAVEEERPVRVAATGVEEAPGLQVAGRRRPTRSLEEDGKLRLGDRG